LVQACFSIIEMQHSLIINGEPMHTAPKQCLYRLKRRRFVATRCAAVQINNCLKRTSEIKVATMEITDDFVNAYHKIDTFRGEQR